MLSLCKDARLLPQPTEMEDKDQEKQTISTLKQSYSKLSDWNMKEC